MPCGQGLALQHKLGSQSGVGSAGALDLPGANGLLFVKLANASFLLPEMLLVLKGILMLSTEMVLVVILRSTLVRMLQRQCRRCMDYKNIYYLQVLPRKEGYASICLDGTELSRFEGYGIF